MGVYIKEMEKPEYCRVCHERLKCKQYDGEILHTPDDCPLIEIVTCGECKHWDKAVNGHLNIDDHLCRRALRWTLNTDYCSDGERRADDN